MSAAEDGVLRFADVESLQDLGTYVARARSLEDSGAIRLQAAGRVLAAWVCVLPGRGVLGEGVVLALRAMPLATEHQLDVTVPLAAIADRMARRAATGEVSASLAVPPTTVSAPWSALTPPRGGWTPVGQLSSSVLLDAARQGIAAVAEGTPTGPDGRPAAGVHALSALRRAVWGEPLGVGSVTAGAGLAALGMGFAREGEEAAVHSAGPWTRVTLSRGHVLQR